MRQYVAVTGDIIGSTKISKAIRAEVQEKVKSAVNQVNREYQAVIITKFSITGGDEFQGLINSLKKSLLIVRRFEQLLCPIKLRFGIGLGELSTEITETVAEMDGECFYLSRKALEQAKRTKQDI